MKKFVLPLLAVLALSACEHDEVDDKIVDVLKSVSKIGVKVNLLNVEGVPVTNQDVTVDMQIKGMGTVRENYYGDAGRYYADAFDHNRECNPYIARRRGDNKRFYYNTPPLLNWETDFSEEAMVDSEGKINNVFVLASGTSTSNDFRDECSVRDVSFESIDSILLTVKLAAKEEVCREYCGVQVRTYCYESCRSSVSTYATNVSADSSCVNSCTVTETPFCNENCKTKEHLLAQASIYPDQIIEKTEGVSNAANGTKIAAGGSGTIQVDDTTLKTLIVDRKKGEATLKVDLKLEPYVPLNI